MVTFLLSWLVYPLLVIALSLGIGLLVRALAGRQALPGVLLLPVGFAGAVVVVVIFTLLSQTAPLAGVALALVAVVGFVVARREVRGDLRPSHSWLWPGLAALLPAGSVAAPIVLTGQAGLTGYGRIVDTGHQLMLADWLSEKGRTVPIEGLVDSSYIRQVFQLTNVGYPGGSQAALGATSDLLGIDALWTYQVFLALVAGTLGLALYSLLARAISSPGWRALAAGVAAQPTILYSYTLAGGIKELSAIAALAVLAALLVHRRPADATPRELLPAALAVACAFAVFSLGIVPWLGMLVGLLLAVDLATRPRRLRTVGRWAMLGVAALVICLPTVQVSLKLAPTATGALPLDLGNLAVPVPAWAAVGPWLTGDHRFPLEFTGRETLTYLLAAIVLAFAVLGLACAVRRVDLGLLALGVAAVVALVYVTDRAGPWIDLKAFTITAPITMALAFAGAWVLCRGRWLRWVARGAMVAIAATVLAGNALVYNGISVTPYDRFAELERLGEVYAGQGPALFPAFEELGEYLLRDTRATGIVNAPQSRFVLSPSARTEMVFSRDPDAIDLAFLEEFDLLFLRREPGASRPPSNWRLEERGTYYEVWRRRKDAPRVVAHLALQGEPGERDAGFCRDVGAIARDAGPDAWIAYALAPDVVRYTAQPGTGPPTWAQNGPEFVANGPGRLKGTIELPRQAAYTVWLQGSIGRQVRVLVDGEEVGAVRWEQSYPGQHVPVGTAGLAAGRHTVEIVRGGGTLLPGTGNELAGGLTTTIGPLAFAPEEEGSRLRYAEPAAFRDLCAERVGLDWVEVLVPPQAPPGDGARAPG
jgi:hypothetical protein